MLGIFQIFFEVQHGRPCFTVTIVAEGIRGTHVQYAKVKQGNVGGVDKLYAHTPLDGERHIALWLVDTNLSAFLSMQGNVNWHRLRIQLFVSKFSWSKSSEELRYAESNVSVYFTGLVTVLCEVCRMSVEWYTFNTLDNAYCVSWPASDSVPGHSLALRLLDSMLRTLFTIDAY